MIPSPTKAAIEITNLRIEYRGRGWRGLPAVAVSELTLEVATGEVFGFLGPNGAGKTSTLQVLLGFQPPTSGRALVHGAQPSDPAARRRIGYLPEQTSYYPFLTGEELLRFYGTLFGLAGSRLDQRVAALLRLVGLQEAKDRRLQTYSKGMQQRAGLAQALINDPDVVILDEPASGLDPVGRVKVREVIQNLKAEGKTVFFSSHELGEVETVCDRVAILDHGELRVVGRVAELIEAHGPSLEQVFLNFVRTEPASAL
jgi:ABC-2 type transport system ATP-binding protein